MEDRYVLLVQRVIDENTRLREAIEARDKEQKRVLEELSAKFQSNSTSTPARTTSRKRKRMIAVSPQCRVSINVVVYGFWYIAFCLIRSLATLVALFIIRYYSRNYVISTLFDTITTSDRRSLQRKLSLLIIYFEVSIT